MALFSKKKSTSVALIDVDSASVGGALVHISNGTPPTIYYTYRCVIEPKEHESSEEAMMRTLHDVAQVLVTNGAPILRHETGSGHSDHILVSVGSPWQKTAIRTETISDTKPFVFTKAIVSDATRRGEEVPTGYRASGESIIATLLNGYDIPKPFGKKVNRADIIILSSLIQKSVANAIEQTLRKTYHTHALTLTAFAPLSCSVFHTLYPHEKDFLVLQVSGQSTDAAFVKRGLLVNVANVEYGMNNLLADARAARPFAQVQDTVNAINILDAKRNQQFSSRVEEAEKIWIEKISSILQKFATKNALPRTIFLLSDTDSSEYLRRMLDSKTMQSLWLTDDPLRVISVVAGHFTSFVVVRGEAVPDVSLSLLALFAQLTENTR